MPQVACSRKYQRLSGPKLSEAAGYVIAGLTDNPLIYKNPEPTITVLTELKSNYDAALLAAGNRGRVEVAEKNQATTALIAGLDEEAMYVNSACKGDLSKLLKSGFQPVST